MNMFGEKKAALERLGWRVSVADEYRGEPGVDRQKYKMDLFRGVQLPLTGTDWCRLCMGDESQDAFALQAEEKSEDGEPLYYLSECDGWRHTELKDAQRILRRWFYEGGGVSVEELVRFGELVRDHGDDFFDEGTNPFHERTPEQMAEYIEYGLKGELSGLGKIAVCYHLTKDHYVPEVPEAQHERKDELEGAFHLVHSMGFAFGMGDFFTNRTWETETTTNADRTIRLRRFLPAFKIVYERAKELAPDPIEGWALVDLEKGEGEVAENMMGYCIYGTRAEAERLLAQWRNAQDEHEDECCTPRKLREPIDTRMKIRAVRVSLEEGIEFLDEGAEPKPRVTKWKRKPHWLETETEDLRMLFDQYCEGRTLLCSRERDKGDDYKFQRAYDEAFYAWEEAAKFFGDLD